jgi:cell division septum initiation protein DivIVA
MKLPEILRALHQMQKDTSRLLFEAAVNENEMLRKAVAKADLALGNAASLVRQNLCGVKGGNETSVAAGQNGRYGKATSQQSARVLEKTEAAREFIVASKSNEPELEVASGVSEDALPDHEYAVHLPQTNWEYLDTVQHPDDRLNP